ncbi:MAG TPA: hypothetical protein VI216_02055, partial [Candidatus Acidoferrales bacterium]
YLKPSVGSHPAMRHSRSFASAFSLSSAARGGLHYSHMGEVNEPAKIIPPGASSPIEKPVPGAGLQPSSDSLPFDAALP